MSSYDRLYATCTESLPAEPLLRLLAKCAAEAGAKPCGPTNFQTAPCSATVQHNCCHEVHVDECLKQCQNGGTCVPWIGHDRQGTGRRRNQGSVNGGIEYVENLYDAVGRIDVYGVDGGGGPAGYTTYRLSLELRGDSLNVYSIYGAHRRGRRCHCTLPSLTLRLTILHGYPKIGEGSSSMSRAGARTGDNTDPSGGYNFPMTIPPVCPRNQPSRPLTLATLQLCT